MSHGGQVSRYNYQKALRKSSGPRRGTRDNINCAKILKQHHEDLKHDPERLSTKFIADVVGCKCMVVKPK